MHNKMNIHKIEKVKNCTMNMINLSNIEENLLRQRAKINWTRPGDINNSYFYANLKIKLSQANIDNLKDDNGKQLTNQTELEDEFLSEIPGMSQTQNV